MANFYEVSKEIRGKKYTAQFSGLSTALKAVDSCYIEGTNNTSTVKMTEYLFNNVLVEPKGLKIDDFEDMDEYNEVVGFAREVMQGKFRQEANKTAAEEKSKG
ncbi:MAG: hypothetical protein IJH40_07080 [Ruminococcus sp.]|uniref:hypothetical protein n=1 Tax=Ruminococcus sp. TaxID=41978 RepID=UPI002872C15A|nr:hypothetical protein [Ruminococcus sp.]MBQ3285388.1 hypothetical protein [Ruminococcus sp.]